MIYGSQCPSPTYKSMHIVDVIHAFFVDMVFENLLYLISAHGYIFCKICADAKIAQKWQF